MMSCNAATKTTSTETSNSTYASLLETHPGCVAVNCGKMISIISSSREVVTTFTRPEAMSEVMRLFTPAERARFQASEVTSMLALCDRTLVVAWDDGTVQKWSLDDPRPRKPLWEVRIDTTYQLKVAALDGRVVVGREDGTIYLLGGADGAQTLAAVCDELDYHLREVISLGGRLIEGTASFATFSSKGGIYIWRRPQWALTRDPRFEATRVRHDLTIKFYAVAHHLGDGCSSDSSRVAVMGPNCSVHLFKLSTWELMWEVPALYKEIDRQSGTPALVFSPDGVFVAVAPWLGDQTVRLISAKTGEVLRTHTLDHVPDTFLYLSSSSNSIFTGVFADDEDEGHLQEGEEEGEEEEEEEEEDGDDDEGGDEGDVEDEKFRVGVWRPFREGEARIGSLLSEMSPADLAFDGEAVLKKLFSNIRRTLAMENQL
jgi:WD40 repeat protein